MNPMMMRRRRGRRRTVECPICTETNAESGMITMHCCGQRICKQCMQGYCAEKMNEGFFKIGCPFNECEKHLDHGMIIKNLEEEKHKVLFEKLIAESVSDPCVKACPGCSAIERVSKEKLKIMNSSNKSWFSNSNPEITQIKCSNCDTPWCFTCHAPWHKGMSCSTYLKGDSAFSQWMYWKNGTSINAHFCPKCRIPIQRSSGCPSMVCSFCKVSWCYDCGQSKAWDYTILGPHYSKIALKGCLAPAYLYFNSIPITYLFRISMLMLMALGFFVLGSTILTIVVPIILLLIPALTILPLLVIFKRQQPINGVAPYRIFKDSFARSVRVCMMSLVAILFVIMGPVVLLAGATLLPMLGYLSYLVRRM